MVSRFSKTRVTSGPIATRRIFFMAMIRARNSSRSRSYARRSAMSSSVSWAGIAPSFLGEPVGPRQQLQRVERDATRLLTDGPVGQVTIAGDRLASGAGDGRRHRLRPPPRQRGVLGPGGRRAP